MRKWFKTFLLITLGIILLKGGTRAFAAVSPNYATNQHNDWSIYYYGYVQCQPSYVENGNHAARAYLRYWRYDQKGNIEKDTGRIYTEYGNGPTDSRILSKSYTFTDSVWPNSYKTQFRYGFTWVPQGGIWPVSYPIAPVQK